MYMYKETLLADDLLFSFIYAQSYVAKYLKQLMLTLDEYCVVNAAMISNHFIIKPFVHLTYLAECRISKLC